jgi:multidrug efflux pump subunit AcrA (membrane-fusion protein)
MTHQPYPPHLPFQARVGALVCCAALGLAISGCKKAEKPEEVVAPVRVSPAIKGSIRLIVNVDAVLYPRDQANIVPKISAPVRRFLVNRGDHVKQGQLLAELETAPCGRHAEGAGEMRAGPVELPIDDGRGRAEQMAKAQADVAAARETMDAAKTLLDNRQQLFKDGAR